MENFGKFMYSLLLLVAGLIFNGWIIMLSYNMLITKMFETKDINLVYGVAFSLLTSFFKNSNLDKINKDSDVNELTNNFFKSAALKGLLLLMIYITSLFL